MSALTLPGSIPGLLRRCSPVVYRGGPDVGVVVEPGNDVLAPVVAWDLAYMRVEGGAQYPSDLQLVLTEATGRAHAAWWLNTRRTPSLVPFRGHPTVSTHIGVGGVDYGHRVVKFSGFVSSSLAADAERLKYLPSLAGLLAPTDRPLAGERFVGGRLPDGSRWVDAEALRLVVLHVAGL